MSTVRYRGLTGRFNGLLAIIYLLTVLITVPAVYFYTQQEVYQRAREELKLMLDVVDSVQSYVANDLRPHHVARDIYYSPAISGIVAVARVSKYLKERQPQFYVKVASDNPLNPANRAKGLENALLKRFRNDRGLQRVDEVGTIDGRSYLVNASPKVSKPDCMRCHGDPVDAPEDVLRDYGKGSGYGYRPDQVVGVSLVGVPLARVEDLALQRGLVLVGAVTVLFAILFVVLNLVIRRVMLQPIVSITEVAKAVSGGDLDRPMHGRERRDEIGDLANAFELMRRSLVAAMKRMEPRG